MKDRVGRTSFPARIPRTGLRFRAFFLPALFLTVFLCACLSGASLPLPHPIPPPAEDPPPATKKPVQTTTKTKPATQPTTTTTKPAASTTNTPSTTTKQPAPTTTTSSSSSPIRVNSQPLRDVSGNVVTMNGNYGGSPVLLPVEYTAKPNEFRGIWVATAFNLDFPKHETAAEFQTTFRSLAARIAAMGFN
ncbi:MAG: hypothetical protein IKP09_04920, partial [Lentisphaeria bacterium]|nr:hypothetical protein [Lentisphaeria bacterium]